MSSPQVLDRAASRSLFQEAGCFERILCNIKEKLQYVWDYEGPILCNLLIDEEQKLIPKLEFGNPLEDMSPYLTDKQIKNNMIINMIPRRDNTQGWVTLKK